MQGRENMLDRKGNKISVTSCYPHFFIPHYHLRYKFLSNRQKQDLWGHSDHDLWLSPTDTWIFVPKSKLVPKFKKLPQGVLKILCWQKWVRRKCMCVQIGCWTSWKYHASSHGYRPQGCVTKHPYTVSRRGIKAAQNERKALFEIVISVLLTDKCICTEAQTHTSAALSFLL